MSKEVMIHVGNASIPDAVRFGYSVPTNPTRVSPDFGVLDLGSPEFIQLTLWPGGLPGEPIGSNSPAEGSAAAKRQEVISGAFKWLNNCGVGMISCVLGWHGMISCFFWQLLLQTSSPVCFGFVWMPFKRYFSPFPPCWVCHLPPLQGAGSDTATGCSGHLAVTKDMASTADRSKMNDESRVRVLNQNI